MIFDGAKRAPRPRPVSVSNLMVLETGNSKLPPVVRRFTWAFRQYTLVHKLSSRPILNPRCGCVATECLGREENFYALC